MNEITLPSHKYLDGRGLEYKKISFPITTEKGAANVAKILGFREEQIIKTLIFEVVQTKEKVLIMIASNKSAISGNLKKILGSKDIKMATLDDVQKTTGYVVGSIPPFSWQPLNFRTFIDKGLMSEEQLGVGSGQWGEEIIIKPADLVNASNSKIVNLTEPMILITKKNIFN